MVEENLIPQKDQKKNHQTNSTNNVKTNIQNQGSKAKTLYYMLFLPLRKKMC